MSIGSFGGVLGSASGVPLPQKGSDAQRAQADSTAQQRGVELNQHADNAAGVGQTEEDREAGDRDADGRRLWERFGREPEDANEESEKQQAKDTTGDAGNSLDLTG